MARTHPPLFTPKPLILRIQLPTGYNQFCVCSPIFINVSLIKSLVLIFLFVPLKWNGIIFNTVEIEEKSLNEFVSTRDVRKLLFYGITMIICLLACGQDNYDK